MGIFNGSDATTRLAEIESERDQALTMLRAEQDMNLLLQESVADLELAAEDRGWRRLVDAVNNEFTAEGRRAIADICRTLAISHPLIKRGLQLRIGYIWGQGVEIRAKAADQAAQDVNAVVQAFIDDNRRSLFGQQAREELERALGTDGGVVIAAFTAPITGRVQARSTPIDEIVDIITNPDDRDEVWFYLRETTQRIPEPGATPGSTRLRTQTIRHLHPDLDYRPATRAKEIGGIEIRWDVPMMHVPVNRLDGWKYGIPDAYASASYARAYRDFIVDWALVMKSLAKFSWALSGGDRGRTQRAAQAVASRMSTESTTPAEANSQVGQLFAGADQLKLEAIPKSGATIDAGSGKPLAAMIAAGLGVPVTMLLADPGVTGARAVAETLDLPTILEMGMRRLLWQDKLTQLIGYVIDQAVLAPRGPLSGSRVRDDWGRQIVTLAGDVERTLEFDWPPLADVPVTDIVSSIVAADGTQLMPELVTLRLLLNALGVKDVDEILDGLTDEEGRFVAPRATAADVAVDAFNRGEDPAASVR